MLLILSMVLLAVLQIVLRNAFGGGLIWIDPLLRIMVLWVGLLGAMAASRQNQHITIDVLSKFLPARFKRPLQSLVGLLAAALCLLLAWHGLRFTQMEYESATQIISGLPSWCCVLILPFAFGVMALRFFLYGMRPPAQLGSA